jgi:excisionase family DNA binding protein
LSKNIDFLACKEGDVMEKTAENTIKETDFFTTAELAEKLKMNVQVITRKVQAGEIAAYKIGKDWRIPEKSVREWLESHSNQRTRGQVQAPVEEFPKPEQFEHMPSRRSKRKYLLEYILAQFEPNRAYSEEEVNRIIGRYHNDSGSVRAEFVSENMMELSEGRYRRRGGYKFAD